MADIGFTALTTISNVKKGSSTATGTLKRYSDGSFEATFAGVTKRLEGGLDETGFVRFVFDGINALV
jgi:hypothetical protein